MLWIVGSVIVVGVAGIALLKWLVEPLTPLEEHCSRGKRPIP